MKARIVSSATILSLMLIGAAATAGNAPARMQGDMMNGHGMKPHKDMTVPAPAGPQPRQELKDDQLYSGNKIESHGVPPTPAVAGADPHDNSESMMHN